MLQNNTDIAPNDADITCSSIDEVKQLRGRLSLKLLNTLDPFIENIINQTPFVTGYYMSPDNKWSRMGIEGFLYVVKRSRRPLHSFILINKKSENHLVEYITPEFQMNQNGNFIFYRSKDVKRQNTMNSLQGLWFFDEAECKNTYEKLKEITNNASPLQYNFNALNTLYDNSEDAPLVIGKQDKEQTKESKDKKIKSIGSFLLDSISLKSKTKKNEEGTGPTKQLEKFKMDEDPGPGRNMGGKHLMTLLKSAGKGEPQNSSEESDSETIKMINMNLKVIDSPVLSQSSTQEQTLTISYETLKSAIAEVVSRDEIVSQVWEELKKRSNGIP
ncbi:uncharacterized protein TOT_040000172 [Theileria orientalis strain Shintoku]|uniref:Uncharacterized protein n=1 Tax=Theileria orientalis strain Shintoku TaxID=869250 RepID=J4DA60_THEOR|nr:uncharacterized protein TOT_040000172 [Theileria orientalis strain Shintoku]PVC53670.1 hypothetical protein MACL_00003698 [Theileria orientalis]BAM41790.1 uncharacterized protein TOT_040000172 [Theileria orientalis strain Shintoku]|eukprot:XP_009692091.1 uncharacterized protein TOT_040000172 [Theileria orientalis strain Shintoku]